MVYKALHRMFPLEGTAVLQHTTCALNRHWRFKTRLTGNLDCGMKFSEIGKQTYESLYNLSELSEGWILT